MAEAMPFVDIDFRGAICWYIIWHPYEAIMFMTVFAVLLLFLVSSIKFMVDEAIGGDDDD